MPNACVSLKNIRAAEEYSERMLANLRTELSRDFGTNRFCIVTTGSFARRDASELSDLDYIVISHRSLSEVDSRRVHKKISELLLKEGVPLPSADGAFARSITIPQLTTNIGGKRDINDSLTWRMLVLLECDHLIGPDLLVECRQQMVERYINDHIRDRNIIRFFLNDLIRYHKTMGVDFEFKTSEDGKSWGTRNIKLQFSRKLLYFSGVLVVAESADMAPEAKRSLANNMFAMMPRQRITQVCGQNARDVFELYDGFLGRMSDPEFRAIAENATIDRNTHDEKFREAKLEGHRFSDALYGLLIQQYPPDHPIHKALVL